MTEASAQTSSMVEITSELVAAYVSRNSVPAADLPRLVRSIHDTLAGLGASPAAESPPEPRRPAVPVKKSVTEDYIISLEDGRKLKAMKRYLAGLGMTPADYRAKWGLPADYPMVAPAYARQRSELARTIGLGRKAAGESAPEPEAEPAEAAPAEQPEKRGRRKTAA